MVRTATLSLGFLIAVGCTGEPSTAPTADLALVSGAGGPAEHVSGTFAATANCAVDIGYSIAFGGQRELVRQVAGNDTTLSFRTQQFQGWRLPETTLDQSTVDYEVLGGAEMFNIKRYDDATGAVHVKIHEGTLVFAALDGSHKVVARHEIRIIPSQGVVQDGWSCRVVG